MKRGDVKKISVLLARIQQINDSSIREEKMYQAHKLFQYLAHQKNFMDQHKKFKDTVAAKLLYFYHVEDLKKEAKDWWLHIFGHEMLL